MREEATSEAGLRGESDERCTSTAYSLQVREIRCERRRALQKGRLLHGLLLHMTVHVLVHGTRTG